MKKKIYIISQSCPSGHYETEKLRGLFIGLGWKILKGEEENTNKYIFDDKVIRRADLIIYNTCAVTEETADFACKVISQVQLLIKEESELIVCGCLPKTNAFKLKKIFKGFSFSWGEINKLEKYLQIPSRGEKIQKDPIPGLMHWNVRIATGCVNKCYYCADKNAIGNINSRFPEEIIEEIYEGLNSGYGKIELSAHDSGAYGYDIGLDLPFLLRNILEIKESFSLGIDCINPQHLKKYLNELIEVYKDDRVIKYIHPPVQSGSNRILRLMNRKYTREDFINCLNKIKTYIPEIEFGTDIIVGYPYETEQEFKKTLRIVASFTFKFLNVFPYSARPNTIAISYPNQIEEEAKQERKKRVLDLWEKIITIPKK